MPKDDAVQRIIEALEAAATNHDIDIVDVEVVGSVKAPVVRVRIDHADENAQTISLDEVAAETGWISLAIDELDPFPNSFTLEVSSPGMILSALLETRSRCRQRLQKGVAGLPANFWACARIPLCLNLRVSGMRFP